MATLGSSNFTDHGFRQQSEANARFEAGAPEFGGTVALAEGFWAAGQDYSEALVDLLGRLLREVSWQEALARACAEVLEGEWARRYVPPEEIDGLDPPLWPHQFQGISQALYALIHQGSVLVADATGSGKTRMGAWLLRAAFDRQVRLGGGRRTEPLLVAPPPVVEPWQDNLAEAGLTWTVESHGPLSNTAARAHKRLLRVLEETEILAIDEAHNFVNPSSRTIRVLSHYADNVVLFTATPINKGAADLLAMVELLGADNFSDETLDRLQHLSRLRRTGPAGGGEDVDAIRQEIQRFLVRRTRNELNAISAAAPDCYRLPGGRVARYPGHRAKYYEVSARDEDIRIAEEIDTLAGRLLGVARVGRELRLPLALRMEGINEAAYVRRLVSSAKALARHMVLECLRSSRIALCEHVHGTEEAVRRLGPAGFDGRKSSTGNTVGALARLGGKVPKWHLQEVGHGDVETWLWDRVAHASACDADAENYRKIAELGASMSAFREEAKIARLIRLRSEHRRVIAFDSHLLSLLLFAESASVTVPMLRAVPWGSTHPGWGRHAAVIRPMARDLGLLPAVAGQRRGTSRHSRRTVCGPGHRRPEVRGPPPPGRPAVVDRVPGAPASLPSLRPPWPSRTRSRPGPGAARRVPGEPGTAHRAAGDLRSPRVRGPGRGTDAAGGGADALGARGGFVAGVGWGRGRLGGARLGVWLSECRSFLVLASDHTRVVEAAATRPPSSVRRSPDEES